MMNKTALGDNNTNLIGYDDADTLGKLNRARYGSHYIIIYSDLPALRKIYSEYIKRQIEEKKKLFLSFRIMRSPRWSVTCYLSKLK